MRFFPRVGRCDAVDSSSVQNAARCTQIHTGPRFLTETVPTWAMLWAQVGDGAAPGWGNKKPQASAAAPAVGLEKEKRPFEVEVYDGPGDGRRADGPAPTSINAPDTMLQTTVPWRTQVS